MGLAMAMAMATAVEMGTVKRMRRGMRVMMGNEDWDGDRDGIGHPSDAVGKISPQG